MLRSLSAARLSEAGVRLPELSGVPARGTAAASLGGRRSFWPICRWRKSTRGLALETSAHLLPSPNHSCAIETPVSPSLTVYQAYSTPSAGLLEVGLTPLDDPGE